MIFFAFIIAAFFSSKVIADDKEIKILVLTIASDTLHGSEVFEPYLKMQDMWRSYMHLDPAHVEAYFIRADPELPVQSMIKGDVIWSKTEECVMPGLLRKTLLSLEHMLPRLHEFDYILRPNLSSFFVFPRLLEFLKTAPREGCYCGPKGPGFVSGCGFIISPDVAEMLVKHKDELWNSPLIDDVAIGHFLLDHGIRILDKPYMELIHIKSWHRFKDHIPSDVFHFRTKNVNEHLRGTDELFIQSELFKMFYGTMGD
jgi:hypothetical protein